jgi:uncharacterized protein
MNNTIPAIIVAVALVAMAWLLANKQVTTINTLPASGTIQTVAEGHVTVSPDTVTLSLAIMKRASTSKEAYADVNTGIAALRAILKTAWVADTDIQTTSIYMTPEYNYDGGKNTPNGFSATHNLSVKVKKLDTVNTLLDSIAGVTDVQIQGVSYDLADKEKVYAEARKLALEKARTKADEMARVAGVSIRKVQNISESGSPTPTPMYQNYKVMDMAVGGAAPSTTLAPGQLEYSVSMSVTYELN